jgi:hypothetical protein
MQSIIYRTDKKWTSFVGVLIVVGLAFMVSSNPEALKDKSFWLVVAGLILIFLDIYSGMHLSLQGNILIHKTHFFIQKKIIIQDIQNISYGPTWIVGGSFGYSLRIKALTQGKLVYMEIANVGYSTKVLSSLLDDLLKRNSKISLDHSIELLVKK